MAVPTPRTLRLAKPRPPATLLEEWDPMPKPKPYVSDYNRLVQLASEWIPWWMWGGDPGCDEKTRVGGPRLPGVWLPCALLSESWTPPEVIIVEGIGRASQGRDEAEGRHQAARLSCEGCFGAIACLIPFCVKVEYSFTSGSTSLKKKIKVTPSVTTLSPHASYTWCRAHVDEFTCIFQALPQPSPHIDQAGTQWAVPVAHCSPTL